MKIIFKNVGEVIIETECEKYEGKKDVDTKTDKPIN